VTELTVAFTLNGRPCEVRTAAHRTLLEILRDDPGAMEETDGCGGGG